MYLRACQSLNAASFLILMLHNAVKNGNCQSLDNLHFLFFYFWLYIVIFGKKLQARLVMNQNKKKSLGRHDEPQSKKIYQELLVFHFPDSMLNF